MNKLALAVSIATLTLAGLAQAEAPKAGDSGNTRTIARADALERANRMFDRIDANKDGKLDAADREARRTAAFDRMDANKDGSISRAEFAAMRPGMAGRGGGQGGHPGMHAGMHARGMGRAMIMQRADSDRDGGVTRAEFAANAASRFDQADSNRDGQLTPAERQASRAAMRERMHEAMQRRGAGMAAPVPVN